MNFKKITIILQKNAGAAKNRNSTSPQETDSLMLFLKKYGSFSSIPEIKALIPSQKKNEKDCVEEALTQKSDLLIAAGGDGTVRRIAGHLKNRLPLSFCPLGTQNLLAHALGIPQGIQSLRGLGKGKIIKMDSGSIQSSGKIFLLMTGIGLDAQIVKDVSERMKQRWGWLAYAASAFKTFLSPKANSNFYFRADEGKKEQIKQGSLIVMNLPIYAHPKWKLTQELSPDSGDFMLCVLRGKIACVRAATRLAQGKTLDEIQGENIFLQHCHNLEVWPGKKGQKIPMQCDGDTADFLPEKINIRTASIRLLIP